LAAHSNGRTTAQVPHSPAGIVRIIRKFCSQFFSIDALARVTRVRNSGIPPRTGHGSAFQIHSSDPRLFRRRFRTFGIRRQEVRGCCYSTARKEENPIVTLPVFHCIFTFAVYLPPPPSLPSLHTPPGVRALGVFYFPHFPPFIRQNNEHLSVAYVTNLADDSINEYKAALFRPSPVSMNLFPTPPHTPPPSAEIRTGEKNGNRFYL
jgi:hypothetical protein